MTFSVVVEFYRDKMILLAGGRLYQQETKWTFTLYWARWFGWWLVIGADLF
jgi:hypothetical protein